MPRRVRALMALAALAGSMGSPPLLGAAPQPPSLHAQGQDSCKHMHHVRHVLRSTAECDEERKDFLELIRGRWTNEERSFRASNKELGADPYVNHTKDLTLTVIYFYTILVSCAPNSQHPREET